MSILPDHIRCWRLRTKSTLYLRNTETIFVFVISDHRRQQTLNIKYYKHSTYNQPMIQDIFIPKRHFLNMK